MRSVSVPRAVRMMIGTPLRARIVRQTSRPSPSGRWRSSRIRSGSSRLLQLERAGGGGGDVRLEALALERLGERRRDRLLVLDEQDAGPVAHRANVEESRRALPRFNPALAGAWRVVAQGVGHEDHTPPHRRRGHRRRPRGARRRRPRLGRLRGAPADRAAARRRDAGGPHGGRAPDRAPPAPAARTAARTAPARARRRRTAAPRRGRLRAAGHGGRGRDHAEDDGTVEVEHHGGDDHGGHGGRGHGGDD